MKWKDTLIYCFFVIYFEIKQRVLFFDLIKKNIKKNNKILNHKSNKFRNLPSCFLQLELWSTKQWSHQIYNYKIVWVNKSQVHLSKFDGEQSIIVIVKFLIKKVYVYFFVFFFIWYLIIPQKIKLFAYFKKLITKSSISECLSISKTNNYNDTKVHLQCFQYELHSAFIMIRRLLPFFPNLITFGDLIYFFQSYIFFKILNLCKFRSEFFDHFQLFEIIFKIIRKVFICKRKNI